MTITEAINRVQIELLKNDGVTLDAERGFKHNCSFSIFAGLELPYCREQALGAIQGNKRILHRCIADYIGGMTDQFAYDEFDRLYGTRT